MYMYVYVSVDRWLGWQSGAAAAGPWDPVVPFLFSPKVDEGPCYKYGKTAKNHHQKQCNDFRGG